MVRHAEERSRFLDGPTAKARVRARHVLFETRIDTYEVVVAAFCRNALKTSNVGDYILDRRVLWPDTVG